MNTMTPVDIVKHASNFRLYLRNNYYPNNQQLVQDTIYNTIPDIVDINYQPNMLEYCVKCTNKKNSPSSYDMNVENAIVGILGNSFPEYIAHDFSIDDKTKVNYNIIYKNIISFVHMSWYLKLLYNVCFFQSTNTSRLVMITL